MQKAVNFFEYEKAPALFSRCLWWK